MYWFMQFNFEIFLALCIIIMVLELLLFWGMSLYLRFNIFEILRKDFYISYNNGNRLCEKAFPKFFVSVFKILFATLSYPK
jgi:hypothetical protein